MKYKCNLKSKRRRYKSCNKHKISRHRHIGGSSFGVTKAKLTDTILDKLVSEKVSWRHILENYTVPDNFLIELKQDKKITLENFLFKGTYDEHIGMYNLHTYLLPPERLKKIFKLDDFVYFVKTHPRILDLNGLIFHMGFTMKELKTEGKITLEEFIKGFDIPAKFNIDFEKHALIDQYRDAFTVEDFLMLRANNAEAGIGLPTIIRLYGIDAIKSAGVSNDDIIKNSGYSYDELFTKAGVTYGEIQLSYKKDKEYVEEAWKDYSKLSTDKRKDLKHHKTRLENFEEIINKCKPLMSSHRDKNCTYASIKHN